MPLKNQHTRELISARINSPTISPTWHASKYKVHKLHQKYIFNVPLLEFMIFEDAPLVEFMYLVSTSMPGEFP